MLTQAIISSSPTAPHQHAEHRPDPIGQLALDLLESQHPLHVGWIVGRIRRSQFGGERDEAISSLLQ
jgi:hypothetical protein